MIERMDFEVLPRGRDWAIQENGKLGEGVYATREAAFEALVGSASNALKEGMEVSILIAAVENRTL